MKKTIKLNNLFMGLMTCCCLFFSYNGMSQNTYYVIEGATGSGTSWSDASGDIQLLINNASAGDQIWVAAGTYKPNRPADDLNNTSNPVNRDNAFVLKAGVEIYGGFTGDETSLEERDWFTNPAILSGDFNDDDEITGAGSTLEITGNSENAHHVVISANDDTLGSAVLDGFIITGANGNETSNITVNSVTISRGVGAVVVRVSSPVLRNLIVTGNFARNQGGGVVFQGIPATNPKVINSLISKNIAELFGGGGIYSFTEAPFDLINSAVVDNRVLAQNNNGPGGAIFAQGGTTNTINIVNTTIAGNYAYRAGGINMGGTITTNIDNSIVFGNSGNSFPNIYNTLGTMTFSYSLVEGSGGSASWDGSIFTPGGAAPVNGGNNIDDDPEFSNAPGGNYTLQETSPAVNAGSNTLYTDAGGDLDTDKDLAGNDRLIDGTIDMGAYEFGEVVVIPVCTIECPEDIVVTIPASQSTAVVTYDVTFGCDNSDDVTLVLIEGLASGSEFPVGETTVTYQLEFDGTVLETCSFTVTVDQEDPVCTITCPGNIFIAIPASQSTAVVTYDVTFDCDNSDDIELVLAEGLPSGSAFPVGETEVAYQLIYNDNVIASCAFTVTVTQNDPVCVIACPLDITVEIPASQTTATVNYPIGFNCDNTDGVSLELVQGLPSGGSFPIGDTDVTYQLVYEDEVLDTCTFTVTVIQNDPVCTIECPEDIVVSIPEGQTSENVDYEVLFDCDNTDGVELVLVEGLASGSDFPVGETIIVYNLEYEGEILDSCTFSVTVETYLSIDEYNIDPISVYPNPVTDILNISYTNTISEVIIYDISGKQILAQKTNQKEIELNLSHLSAGVYWAGIVSENGIQYAKILKN